ncbi:MAG TPA: rhomboid family intramembrane serine protease [Gemmatimonadales bacterium]|nr:rhomboid family intramembrane serine protease [Gemmatimonadales bacterium]
MFPYKDDNPTELTPYITVAVIALNVLAWVVLQGMGAPALLAHSVCRLGLIPGELLRTVPPHTVVPLGPGLACTTTAHPAYATVLTSMFMHGGWFHLIGNMWFLWIFGNNVEDAMGHGRFVVFYLLCGLVAAATQVAASPGSAIPMIGASGAISGVLGAYLVLFPRVRVHTLIFLGFFVTTIALPAYLMLLYWFLLQLLGGLPSLTGMQGGGGVAFFAHIGGFVAGAALIRIFLREDFRVRIPRAPPGA